jgi:hypothetical protein
MSPERPKDLVSPLPDWSQPQEDGDGVVFHNAQIIPAVPGHVEFWTSEPCRTLHEAYGKRLLHRQDGPAEIYFGTDGEPESERWYRHGQRHRDDGPAEVVHGDNQEREDTYWLYDELVTKARWEDERKTE